MYIFCWWCVWWSVQNHPQTQFKHICTTRSVQLQTHSCCNRNQLKSTWSVQLLFNYYSINLNNQFNYTLLHIFSAYSSSAYWFKAQKVQIQSTLWYSASLILCILIFKMWTDSKHFRVQGTATLLIHTYMPTDSR